MYRLLEILASLILLSHHAAGMQHGDVLVINDASFTHQNAYEVVPPTDRVKRDQSPWFFPDIDKEHIACGQNVYVKLFTCSNLKDCRTFSSCLDSLRCPLSVKSNGGLILNLLRQLGMDKCNDDDANQQCPHDKRLSILKRFFAFWSHHKDDNYCRTFSTFTEEIKKDIQEQCPLSLRQVETFLENYACLPLKDALASLTSTTSHPGDVHEQAHLFNIDNPSTTPGTVISSQFAYIDEDNDLKFVSTNKNLFNSTEQTVIVNDHRYYNASYIIPKSEGNLGSFVHDNSQFVRIHALSKRHRSAFGIALKFGFPFYGHTIHKVLVATGGFIYTGELLHSALIGSTQYIAPFMANFDASIGDNETGISYFDNSTHFICTWNRVYLQDQREAGPFTFQTILQNTGNIYFNYLQLPKVKVSSANHAHRIGLSDAYLSQHSTNEHIVRVITLYDKINLDKDKIQNGVSVVFDMDQTCNTFTDCSSCLANRGIRYNCSWCDDIHKCSDGLDRSHQQWMRSQCHRLASESTCPNSLEDAYDDSHVPSSTIAPSVVQLERRKSLSTSTAHHLSTFRTIVVTLLLSVLILSLVTMGVTYIYAYRNPMSPAGMWLLEHRPSTYIARFKRFTGSN